MSDFVNRRLALGPMKKGFDVAKGTRINFINWIQAIGMTIQKTGILHKDCGAVSNSIAESGLNDYEDPNLEIEIG